jgi:hypothetical protein
MEVGWETLKKKIPLGAALAGLGVIGVLIWYFRKKNGEVYDEYGYPLTSAGEPQIIRRVIRRIPSATGTTTTVTPITSAEIPVELGPEGTPI